MLRLFFETLNVSKRFFTAYVPGFEARSSKGLTTDGDFAIITVLNGCFAPDDSEGEPVDN